MKPRASTVAWREGRKRRKRWKNKCNRCFKRNKNRMWRDRTDSGQSIFTMFWPAQMMRWFPLIATGSMFSPLFMWVGASDPLCRQQRFGSDSGEKTFLPRILHCINILLKMSLNVIACYFCNITGDYMTLCVIIV